jgi:hypothetical protein
MEAGRMTVGDGEYWLNEAYREADQSLTQIAKWRDQEGTPVNFPGVMSMILARVADDLGGVEELAKTCDDPRKARAFHDLIEVEEKPR